MVSAKEATLAVERQPRLPPGEDERLSGWGVMGLPFRSGDVLATRRFTASSIGPAYTSVWYRSPQGQWTFFTDKPPERACPRYFGSELTRSVTTQVKLEWTAEDSLHIEVPEGRITCDIVVASAVASRVMNLVPASLPEPAWRSPRILGLMARAAGPMLRAGPLSMAGLTPNRQSFIANPRKIWMVKEARLRVGDRETDQPGPVMPQAQLGDFLIPQRGILAVGNTAFENFDAARHLTAVTREEL